jgi:hypothetical protein
MIIQVKPIEIKKWHGKTGKESFTRTKIIQALVDPNSMTYCTGLTLEEEKKYSELLKVDLSKQFNIDSPHPFWDSKTAEIRLENRTQILDTNNPLDYIKWKVLKESKYVANSMKEYEEGLYPEATHVIFDESEEIDVKASHVVTRNQAIIETAKLSKDKKIQLIMILSADKDYLKMKNLKGKSDNFVEVELGKLIDKNPSDVLFYLKMDKEYLANYALALEALQKNILTKEGHKIKYYDSIIAQDLEGIIEYLSKVENNEFKLRLMSAINT